MTSSPSVSVPDHPGAPAAGLEKVLDEAIGALRQLQRPDGHWCAELEGDSILQSEYLLMKLILGQENAPMASGDSGPATLARLAARLRATERPEGGWGQYPGSALDLSATVKAYFALKLLGDDPDAPHMTRARDAVLDAGGAEHCNSFTNFYLACLGQISWNAVPAIPPEIVLLPRWFYFHPSKMSAWTRTMILPLSLVTTLRPTRRVPRALGIDELFVDDELRHRLTPTNDAPPAWRSLFLAADRGLKGVARFGVTPLRHVAIRRVTEWILARAGQDGPAATDGLGAIFPPMVYLQIVLHALGSPREHPVRRRAELDLDALIIEDGDTTRLQPCFSPVWDTGIALAALVDCGLDQRDPAARDASAWLRDRQCFHVGDWIQNTRVKTTGPFAAAGWAFEYHNAWYPDIDDTAMVAMALHRTGGGANRAAAARGVAWILSMQNDDGGWAAFDRTRHRQILEYVPFADHNAMQDPSCPDITGRVLECLAWHGFTVERPEVRRAVAYIRSRQEPEGCFFGRWGVNYIYGTWQSVIGPVRCGIDPSAPDAAWLRRAGAWLESIQHPDGAFGESADSYADRDAMGRGPATASQTAWAAMTLQALYGPEHPALHHAIDWLARMQLSAADAADHPDGDPAGSWAETEFTGTGFPCAFYLRYHLYRLYFPIMAIGRFLTARAEGSAVGGQRFAVGRGQEASG